MAEMLWQRIHEIFIYLFIYEIVNTTRIDFYTHDFHNVILYQNLLL